MLVDVKIPAASAVEDPALTLREEGLSSVTFLAKPFLFVFAMGLKLLKKISKLGKRGKDFFEGPGRCTSTPPLRGALM